VTKPAGGAFCQDRNVAPVKFEKEVAIEATKPGFRRRSRTRWCEAGDRVLVDIFSDE